MADLSPLDLIRIGLCPRCRTKGPHFVPPGLGMPGFYMCSERLLDNKVVTIEEFETARTGRQP